MSPTPSSSAASIVARVAAGEIPWGTAVADKMLVSRWTRSGGWASPDVVPVSNGLSLHPSCLALHYGQSVFEGMKVVSSDTQGKSAAIFRGDYHARRLSASAQRVALPEPPKSLIHDVARIASVAREDGWLPTSRGSALYIRPLLIATEPHIGVRRSDEAMLVITCHPVGAYFSSTSKPLELCVDPKGRCRSWVGGIGAAKTGGNYAGSIQPAQEAKEAGFDQILWTSGDADRAIGECGQMNFFWVEKDAGGRSTLVTPELDGTILAGATRDTLLKIAVPFGVVNAVSERRTPLEEFKEGLTSGKIVEMFGCGTGAVVCPVKSVTADGKTYTTTGVESTTAVSDRLRAAMLDIFHQDAPSEFMQDIDVERKIPAGEIDGCTTAEAVAVRA